MAGFPFLSRPVRPGELSALVLMLALASAALLAGAWWFQLVLGLEPCKLCLEQRWPHYAASAVGLAALLGAWAGLAGRRALLAALGALALLMLLSAGMGFYHVGVEQGVFLGPTDCGASAPLAPAGSMADFMQQLQTTRVISCTKVQWSLFGLSMAGWNALISLGLAGLALAGLLLALRRATGGAQGSSSLSQ